MQKEEYIDIDIDMQKVVGGILVHVSSMASLPMISQACDLLTTHTSAVIILHPLDTPIEDVVVLVSLYE